MMKVTSATSEDMLWLARNIYFEARSECTLGKMAVAMVTLNRTTWKGKYPNTIKGVVTQRKQFSWFNANVVPEIKEQSAWKECQTLAGISFDMYNDMAIAKYQVDGIVSGAQFYFADYIKPPKWAAKMTFITKIGHHLFYRL